jgi:hypothetical protein
MLALVGGFSALIGAAVALTQPAVKSGISPRHHRRRQET